jgi:deoxyribodipyrimidine photo-lyase
MKENLVIVWHRNDLRLYDNPVYHAVSDAHKIVSLYVVDPSMTELRTTLHGNSITTGPHACKALIGALADLRRSLQDRGSNLLLRRGNPLDLVPDLCAQLEATHVVWSEEPGTIECELSSAMIRKLRQQNNVIIHTVMGYTLAHPDDLPRDPAVWSTLARPKEKQKTTHPQEYGPINTSPHVLVDISSERFHGMPRIMGDFRRAVRTACSIRACLFPIHDEILYFPPLLEPGPLPTMEELMESLQFANNNEYRSFLGLPATVTKKLIAAVMRQPSVAGGEAVALERLSLVLSSHLNDDNETARISAFLALGVLSPRLVYWQAKHHECEWLVNHLEIRDYFIYTAFGHGERIFRVKGALPIPQRKAPIVWKSIQDNSETFYRWAMGETGLPFIDAGMRELLETGYCSNRLRQNMVSVLTKDFELDWRAGAEWFQICLQDHCVSANFGNWAYFAGVGADPKDRHFRTVSQAIRYDAKGNYVRKWLPKLELVQDLEACFRPWDFLPDWGDVLVDPSSQYTWQDKKRLEETGNLLASCTS